MKISIVIVKLFFLAALFLVSNHNLHLTVQSERQEFFGYYYTWLSDLYSQMVQISGFVVKAEWLPESNKTISIE